MLNLASIKRSHWGLNAAGVMRSRSVADNEISPELKSYFDAITQMSLSVMEVIQQNMFVTFNSSPDWYDEECKNHLTTLKVHANLWNDSLLPKLISVPQTITSYDTLYKINTEILKTYIFQLSSPSISEEQKLKLEQQIVTLIGSLLKGVTTQKSLVDSIICEIQDLKKKFNLDKAFAEDLTEKALKQKEVNEQNVKEMNDEISKLRKEIERLNSQYTGGAIGIGASVTVMGIGIAGAAYMPFMCIFAVIGVAGLIGSIAAMIHASSSIADKTGRIIEKSQSMNKAELDAGYCMELANGCRRVADALEAAIVSLHGISQLWGTLQESMQQLIQELNTGNEQAKNRLYDELLNSINESEAEWQSIVSLADEMTSVEIKTDTDKIHELTVDNGHAVVA